MDVPYESYAKTFDLLFGEELSNEEKEALRKKQEESGDADSGEDTAKSDYVWLPLRFVDPCEDYPAGMVFIEWKDEWRIEDYEDSGIL